MFPLVGVLGSFVVSNIERQTVLNILRWGLATLGFSVVSSQLEKKDVFTSQPQQDAFSTTSTTNVGSKEENLPSEGQSSQTFQVLGGSSVSSSSVDLGVSASGDNLLDVLKSNGEVTRRGFERVIGGLEDLKGVVDARLQGIETAIRDIQIQPQVQSQVQSQDTQLLQVLQGLGAILGAIGMSLEGIRQTLENQRTEVKVSFPQNVGVKILSLPSEVSQYMDRQAESTKRVADALTSEVSIDAEKPVVGGKVLEVIAKSLGVQSQTFADINTFEVSDGDIPDLPADIDLSKIFEFLRVSSQIKGE